MIDNSDPNNFDPKKHVWRRRGGKGVFIEKQVVLWQKRRRDKLKREAEKVARLEAREQKRRDKEERKRLEEELTRLPHKILKNIFV